jgi:hypothetical protein
VIARNRSLGALDHQRRDLHSIKLSYLTEDRAASTITEALAESEALIAELESLSKEAPDAKRHAGNFEPAEAVKSVPLDPSNDASKQVRIGSELDPK